MKAILKQLQNESMRHIMNNENVEQLQLASLRQDLTLPAQQIAKLLGDRKKLSEKVEEFNNRAILCITNERWEQALVYLQSAEQLLQSAAARGHLTDRCLVHCILHNQANCYQNLWQLDQCSNYIEALIFNLNSRKNSVPSSPNAVISRQSKLGLAQYYLQFSAINSQLSNHSGALISARKSLNIIRGEMKQWRVYMQQIRRPKIQAEQKIRLLHIVYRFNDNINLNLSQTLVEAACYYLKNWRTNMNNNKIIVKDARQIIDNFNIKSVMALGIMRLPECIAKYEKQPEMSIVDVYQRIFVLATCYFTIATELRLISLKKSRQRNIEKIEQPEYKQSEIYHLLSILLLALTLSSQCPFMIHLLLSFQNHYGRNLVEEDVQFRKVFAQIIFIKQQRNFREPSIEISQHQEALGSHLSKGSGTMIRKTKGSKQSQRDNKFSLIDPKSKKSKLKSTKKQSKSKKQTHSSKNKHPRQSLSKLPNVKSNPKESIITKSQKSKQSIYQKSPIPSIKLITNPNKSKHFHQNAKSNEKQRVINKIKRKTKLEQNQNQYFLVKKKEEKTRKKSSVSSKKSSAQPRSTGRLPIDSTLETKDNQILKEKKKSAKKSILQHYL